MEQNNIIKIYDFLKKAETYYLATVEESQPRVRPFGTILIFENKLYILTAKSKAVAKQIKNNAKFEISAMDKSGRWIRVSGTLVEDNREQVQTAMLEEYPHLKSTYKPGDENTHTLYFSEAIATIYSFTEEPEVFVL